MKDIELLKQNSLNINENAGNREQDNLTLWTVGGMLLIWIYVIVMSLF